MKESNLSLFTKPKSALDYFRILGWTVLILVAIRFITVHAFPYFGMTEDAMGRWWDYKWSLIGHISGGMIALIIGPFQFWKSFRNQYIALHRLLGKIYILAILLGVVSSTYLSWTSALKIDINWALGLQGLALAWFVTTLMAYLSIRKKRIEQHKAWMIRSYVVTFAFITFRILNDTPFEEYFGVSIKGHSILWISWSIPLLFTEMIMSWNKKYI